MKQMHMKLPVFIERLKNIAATMGHKKMDCEIYGFENVKSAKLQSMRAGRIEQAVEDMSKKEDVERIEVQVIPRVPETEQTVIIRGFDKDGKANHAILQIMGVLHPGEEIYLGGIEDIDDQRPPVGLH